MIRRVLITSVAAVAFAIAMPASGQAQSIFLSAGLTVPIGDFGDVASTGWAGRGGVLFPLGEAGLWAAAEAGYGRNSVDSDIIDESFKLFSGLAMLGYSFPLENSSVAPYVFGGAGILSAKVGDSDSNSEFALTAGGGVAFGSGNARPYLETRLMTASSDGGDIQFFEVAGGVAVALGN